MPQSRGRYWIISILLSASIPLAYSDDQNTGSNSDLDSDIAHSSDLGEIEDEISLPYLGGTHIVHHGHRRGLLGSQAAGNNLSLKQDGTDNIAEIEQSGDDNYADLLQTGDDNAIYLVQLGEGNQTWVTQQGSDSTADLAQFGDGNQLDLMQSGSGLSISVTQYGDNGSAYVQQYD